MSTSPASRIGGQYDVVAPVGSGGAGRVFRATAAGGRSVAVKVLLSGDEARDPAAAARLAREIASLRAIRHPNVVELIDHGVDEAVGPFVVMPFVEGRTLRAVLEADGALLPEIVWPIVAEVADALAAVHALGWVHRDVKPENVVVGSDGQVTLLDFGLALADERSRQTAPGMIAGSIPYMAPEQIEGRDVGPSCDVWSLGVVFWELVAGSRPFARNGRQEEVAAILAGARGPAKKLGGKRVANDVADLLEACLSLDPAARPAAASVVSNARAAAGAGSKEALAAEIALWLAAPGPYRSRTAARRASELAALGRRRMEAGDAFGALEAAEIGLGYKPGDGELRGLLEASAAAPPQTNVRAEQTTTGGSALTASAPPPAARRSRLLPAMLGGLVVLGLGGAALGLHFLREEPAQKAARPDDNGSDDAKPVAGAAPSSAASAQASAAAGGGPAPPFPEVPGIPLAELSNEDPPKKKPAPRPGEPIISRDIFEDPGPEVWLTRYEATLKEKPNDVASHMGKGLALLALGRTADGLRVFDDAESAFPKDPLVASTRGVVAGKQGDLERAEKLFTNALKLDENDASSWRNLGITQSQRGKTRDAYVNLIEALKRDADDLEALKELASIYGRVGHTADAAPLARRIAQRMPRDPEAWLDVSVAETDVDRSLEAIRRALALAPELPRAHERLCIELSKKKAPEAVGACTRGIELSNKKSDEAYNARGLAHFAAGNDAAALVDIDEAIRLDPDHGTYYRNRYLVRSHAGQLEPARRDLEKACELRDKEACAELAKK